MTVNHSRKKPNYLQVVDKHGNNAHAVLIASKTPAEDDDGASNRDPELPSEPLSAQEKQDAKAIIGNAVMHAAMSWVSCCLEKAATSVTVAQVAGGLFDAEVMLAGGGSYFVRVTLALEYGPRLRTLVEPVQP